MNPPEDGLQPWSIAKSEWDSVVVRTDRALRMMRVGGIISVMVAVGACIAAFLVPKSLVVLMLVMGGVAVHAVAFAAFALWKSRDARTTLDQVWDARGSICPWCRVRIDEAPCADHGLSRADQPLLVAYWEALATNDMAAISRTSQELSSRGKFGTRHRFLLRMSRRAVAVFDDRASWRQRLVVVLVMTGLFVLLYAAAMAALKGRFHAVVDVEFVLMTPLLMFGFVAGLRSFRAPLHCRKCRQLCAAPAPNTCPECGADLTKPESLSRSRSQRLGFLWMIPVGVLAFVVAINAGKLLSVLPVSAQVWLYSGPINPPFGFFDDVAKKPLTKEEAIAVADLALELSAPGLRISTSGFIGDGVQSGLLPPIYSEKAARAVVKATLTVDTVGDAIVTTIDPLFASSDEVPAAAPRLVFGGVSIDGGAWANGAAWSLFEDDLDPFLRGRGQLPALPESQLVFTARLEGVAPGRHTVRARCWIVVWGPPWQRYTPNFDESGALIPPAGALGVYPLELEATVTVD